jgi:hypothetical protein
VTASARSGHIRHDEAREAAFMVEQRIVGTRDVNGINIADDDAVG